MSRATTPRTRARSKGERPRPPPPRNSASSRPAPPKNFPPPPARRARGAALGRAPGAPSHRRPRRRRPPARRHDGDGGARRHPRELARAVDLAPARGDRRLGPVRGLDLHTLGGGVGVDPGRDRARRLVLAQGLEGGRGVRPQRIVEDISALPTFAWGPRMTMWW